MIIILGAGESGVGAAILAKSKGFEVFVSDASAIKSEYIQELKKHQIAFEQNQHSEDKILSATEIIKSPGIPQSSLIVQKARAKNIKISSEIEFASTFTKAKIIAITGTNGKTTTTLLIYHLLQKAGLNVGIAGNIGDSFARKVAEENHDFYVLEISSFQLEDIHTFKPNIGLLLNITPDHLDRYDYQLEKYAQTKFRIAENMNGNDVFIYNSDAENIAKYLNNSKLKAALEPFSASFYDNGKLHISPLEYWVEYENLSNSEQQQKSKIIFEKLPLLGIHNAMNMSAAILATLRIGLKVEDIQKHLPTFKNAEHRLEQVAQINGIRFINDSKATNVDAVFYALGSFQQSIIWIAGGVDKGNEYEMIQELVKSKVKALICLGVDNEKLIASFGETVSYIHQTQDVNDAVTKAYHLAEKGDIVLFSPACASFDLFENYIDRGEKFKKSVLNKKHLEQNIKSLPLHKK